jgi:hypothetical protein
MKEVQKNQQEILRLRQRLGRVQSGYNATQQSFLDADDNDETENVSIIKLS